MARREPDLGADILQEADRLLLAHYVPASVVIDANQEIVQVRGQTSLYLELAAGRANLNLFKNDAPRPVAGRAGGGACRPQGEPHRHPRGPARLRPLGSHGPVRVTAIPLKGPPAHQYCLVLFEEQARARTIATEATAETSSGLACRESASATSAAAHRGIGAGTGYPAHSRCGPCWRSATPPMRSYRPSTEEIQASNEELSSLNEELETSKEELQTINEELATANQELSMRNEQLKAAQEYAEAIVDTARSPLVVLTGELRVERANLAFYQLFRVTPPRPRGACSRNWARAVGYPAALHALRRDPDHQPLLPGL